MISCAGKSTLLDILSLRKSGKLSGQVSLARRLNHLPRLYTWHMPSALLLSNVHMPYMEQLLHATKTPPMRSAWRQETLKSKVLWCM